MADKLASYLERLKFDPKLWNSIQAKYLTNFRLVLLLIITILVFGLVNFFSIPRRLNPEIKIPIIIVNTVLPGATPDDIEALVTIPVEDEIQGIEGIDTLTSSSRENSSTIVVQFLSTIDSDKALNDVQKAVDGVNDLPEDANDPSVQLLDFENAPVWTFALVSEDIPTLMKLSEELKNVLEDLPKIARVDSSGNLNTEIQVVVNPIKAQEYGISPITLSQSVSQAASSFPAGAIQSDGASFSLAIDAHITSIEDIRDIRISNAGKVVSLGDIAEIKEAPLPNQVNTLYASKNKIPQPAVQFFAYKTKSADIDDAGNEATEKAKQFLKPYKDKVTVVNVSNTAELITEQFVDLLDEFRSTIILIFILLLLFLGLRQAVIASLTIPLTFLSAIAIANSLGLSLNFLTLFAFLIALGLLIDDTIVVVTAMTRYYSTGKFTPAQTGILVWNDFIVPIWSTTITTIWSFIPLLLATGIIGEFIKPIPIIITATMVSSTAIAVLITIPLMIIFLKPDFPYRVKVLVTVIGILGAVALLYFMLPKNALSIPIFIIIAAIAVILYLFRSLYISQSVKYTSRFPLILRLWNKSKRIVNEGVIDVEKLSVYYMNVMSNILNKGYLRRGVIIFLIVFAIVSYALVPLGLVKNEFFPGSDEDTMYVSVTLPSGTSLQKAAAETKTVTDEIRKVEEVQYVLAETGYEFTSDGERSPVSNSFLLTLHIGEANERKRNSAQIGDEIRAQFKDYTHGELSVIELSGGPPAGADLQIKLLGDDLSVLDQYADRIIAYLEKQPEVTDPSKSVKPGTSKIEFVPDENKLAEANIDRNTLALWLRTYANGFTLDSIRFEEEKDVNFRLSTETIRPEELSELAIQSQNGSVPLLSLGTLKLETNPTLITHEATKRTISVNASVKPGYNIAEVNTKLEKFANEIGLPEGYSWQTGGVNEENQRSINSILQAMILSFILILATMIIEFGSYRQAAIVMLTIPLAVSGVFYIFGLTGTPLSFPALIGVLALFGIVVTNAIVVVEKINSNIRDGMNLQSAIVDASGSRLEPVLLTSVATIFGLLPITISDPLWRGLGGAIISGLFFSGLIKLFFVPIVYYMWYKNSDLKNK